MFGKVIKGKFQNISTHSPVVQGYRVLGKQQDNLVSFSCYFTIHFPLSILMMHPIDKQQSAHFQHCRLGIWEESRE